MESKYDELLNQPVSGLDLSPECKEYLMRLKIQTLCDFICKGWKYHQMADGYKPLYFNEVISFLRDKDLLHYMEGM